MAAKHLPFGKTIWVNPIYEKMSLDPQPLSKLIPVISARYKAQNDADKFTITDRNTLSLFALINKSLIRKP
ncbi:MAG: hypothetical protein ACJAQS_000337 [Porticoccus sp.]|jgi:hypothetical protein